jgi:hypothetical protein
MMRVNKTLARLAAASIVAMGALGSPRAARADVTPEAKAAAEAAFENAKNLMKEGKFAEACAKFQASQSLDPGIGTMLYLADCYEKSGRTASAWAQFLDAAAAAKAAGQGEREQKARERAAALEGKLVRLTINVAPGAAAPGLAVKRDGTAVPEQLWGTPLPLDPGEHVITASAPGKVEVTLKGMIDPQRPSPLVITIPPLADAPKSEVVDKRGTPPLRVAGGVVLGAGGAALVVGGVLGGLAIAKNGSANEGCYANGVCTTAGAEARDAALGLAKGSTIAIVAGGVAAAAGTVMLVIARTSSPGGEKSALAISPRLGGLAVEGAF